jgi:hypothetical protein
VEAVEVELEVPHHRRHAKHCSRQSACFLEHTALLDLLVLQPLDAQLSLVHTIDLRMQFQDQQSLKLLF